MHGIELGVPFNKQTKLKQQLNNCKQIQIGLRNRRSPQFTGFAYMQKTYITNYFAVRAARVKRFEQRN